MRGYAFRALLFLLIGTLPVWLLVRLSKRYPPSFEERAAVERVEAVTGNLERIEALSVGNSHARAIDFDGMQLEGREIGLPWNDAAETEFQIRTLAPKMPRLRTVFIALSYFSFHWANEHGEEDRLLIGRRLFYAATPYPRWMRGDLDNFVVGKSYWLARPDNWQMVLWPLLGRNPEEAQEREYYLDRTNVNSDAELSQHAESRVARTLTAMSVIQQNHPDVAAQTYASLSGTIRLLRERGVRVVLFTPPYYHRYRALYAGEPTLPEMKRLTERLRAEHGVEYYDFSEDELSLEPENFRDSDHLNFRGKERFTQRLAAAMRAGGALSSYAPPSSRE